ncbi:hypothetical protein PRIPAC_79780 [Pristionchus pacificus]|uniref:G protein-coupled receptor n=1 Tax=Pristionchus pacificus TaxID=54126 RepID=A0A2A6CNB2_PRIPA|nr:hypothetical protein PRIPAC_79780 [Pristionchus pacificus]|eukprot:PDM79590.1 G protein-coupled receptor [Pristionchus pacificus]
MRAMVVFDLCETVLITIFLAFTIPFTCVVYWKLAFIPPFSENFTFKLIIVDGSTALLSAVSYLVSFQLCSYPFMQEFYVFIQENRLATAVAIINTLFSKMSLHSALFIALNRLKAVLSQRQKGNDSFFFYISMISSITLTLPAIIDLCTVTTTSYNLIDFGNFSFVVPGTKSTDKTLQVVSHVMAIIISLLTFIVNIILVVFITKERRLFAKAEHRKFNVEIGLAVTSVVSYVFYMMYFINGLLARYGGILFSAGAQYLFLGLSSLTPFWCLIMFTPSIRRLAFNKKDEVTVVSIALTNSTLLVVSTPIACVVYWKLIFVSPFAENFTFKLIVLNGVTSLLSGVAYLISFQLCSYSFMFGFYEFVHDNNLTTAVAIINTFFKKMSLHSALFVALNRLKTVLALRHKGASGTTSFPIGFNDVLFFIISMICSLILTLPATIDLCAFSTSKYILIEKKIAIPSTETVDETLRTISSVLSIVVSLATFVINIILVVYIVKERQRYGRSDNRKYDVEIGLMVTSVVSYIFYMLFFVNGMLAQNFKILFSAISQFLFLGLSSLTPFWCLIMFTPSIRRLVINKNCEISAVWFHVFTPPLPQIKIIYTVYSATVTTTQSVREVNVTISRAHKHNSLERCNNMNYAEKLNFRQSVDLNIRRGVVWYARDSRIRSLRDCNDHYIAHRYYSVRLRCLLETPSRLSLIGMNGTTALLSGVGYLISFQLCSYEFMHDFYLFVQHNNLSSGVAIFNKFFKQMSLHSALFVALNRLKTMMSLQQKGNDRAFFFISIISSLILTLPAIIDLCTFTASSYQFLEFGTHKFIIPALIRLSKFSEIIRMITKISEATSMVVSLGTLVVNVVLVVYLVKERQKFERMENRKFNLEIGLLFTSVVSYIFYMLFVVKTMVAAYGKVSFAAGAQFLFLGLSSLTPFWCLIIFTPSIRRFALPKMNEVFAVEKLRAMNAMLVFDLCETILITLLLILTIPFACVIYWKLLVVPPFAENFTFKLIVFNGATALLNGVAYLLSFQLTSYPFMLAFYEFVKYNNLSTTVAIINRFFNEMSLYTALFVALNRLKTVLTARMKGNDSIFFFISIIGSLVLTLPTIIDLVTFTTSDYTIEKIPWKNSTLIIVFPTSKTSGSEIPSRISNTLSIVMSLATLVVNVILVVYLIKERQKFAQPEYRKFNVEIRLMITSVVSYIFYMLFSINTFVASMWRVPFAAGAQFLFLGLSALTPFWCLIIFTPSIRRLVLNKNAEVSVLTKNEEARVVRNTVLITVLLTVTIPFACFIYWKLFVVSPFADNFTFKLIVFNLGTPIPHIRCDILDCLSIVFVSVHVYFYDFVRNINLSTSFSIVNTLFNKMSLHSALFVALNRLKTVLSVRQKGVSQLPAIIDLAVFTASYYETFEYLHIKFVIPRSPRNDETLFTISNAITIGVSLVTLIVNIILVVYIVKERQNFERPENRKFNVEVGLMVTIVLVAKYWEVPFSAGAQFLFLGLSSLTPFWCLIVFTPSIRRLVLTKKDEVTVVK